MKVNPLNSGGCKRRFHQLCRQPVSSLRLLYVGLACAVVVGCDTSVSTAALIGAGSTSNLTLSPPYFITRTRAIESAALVPEVLVNGNAVGMQRMDDGWSGAIYVPLGEVASLELTWFENLTGESEPLRLATYSDSIGPISTAVTLPLFESDFVSEGIDDDQDGISNLDERQAGSDPRDGSDPAASASNTNDEYPIDVYIARISASQMPPVIDGVYDEVWDSSYFTDVNGHYLSIDNLMLGEPVLRTDGDTEFQWTALHDGVHLYVLVFGEYVEGATLFADSRETWKDDSVEFYIDGDNSKHSSYDQVNDYAFVIPQLKLSEPFEANNSEDTDSRWLRGSQSLPLPQDFTFASCLCTSGRVIWEFRISLEQFGIKPDQPFGIEMQINDDLDSGGRDVKWGWKHPSIYTGGGGDATHLNPSFMGTAILDD